MSTDYDTNNNGNPDTGLLEPGESFNITVGVYVPENAGPWVNTTVSVNSLYGTCYSSSQDSIYVPELSKLILLLTSMLIITIITRKRQIIIKK